MAVTNLFGDLALEATQEAARAAAEDSAAASEETVAVLQAILSRLGYPDQGQGSLRVSIVTGNVGIAGTPTVTANTGTIGGLNSAYDQHAVMLAGAQAIRNQITTS